MANRELLLELDFQGEPSQLRETVAEVTQLRQILHLTGKQLQQTFDQAWVSVQGATEKMSDGLLCLRLNLGKLKKALTEAVAPVAAAVLPSVNGAVRELTRMAREAAAVTAALFGGVKGNAALSQSAQDAAAAEKQLAKAAGSTGKAVRGSLASFDQLERLNSSGGGTAASAGQTPELRPLSPELQRFTDRLQRLIEPVRSIDTQSLRRNLESLKTALSLLGGVISDRLAWAWVNVLVPLGKWTVQTLAPAGVELLTQALLGLSRVMEPVLRAFEGVLPALTPAVEFMRDRALQVLTVLREQLLMLTESFSGHTEALRLGLEGLGRCAQALWAAVQPVLRALGTHWSETLQTMLTGVATLAARATELFLGLTQFLSGTLTGDWRLAWQGLEGIFRSFVNGVIALINGLLSRLAAGLNAMVRALNQLRFSIPDWSIFGDLAGKQFGLRLSGVTPPQIPYLAQGAVLPANRPFLAMVGDQRHGTNIEAPLATIQEAVGLVMGEQTGALLAGFEASIGVQKEILEAVLGIRIGDDVIGRAAGRYQQKIRTVRGCGF